jgi:hypothetical protein
MKAAVFYYYYYYWYHHCYRHRRHCQHTMWWESLYIKWICICTVVFETQSDLPQCSVWRVLKHLWCNGDEHLFHSSVQLVIFVILARSTCPLIMSHKELSSVLQSGICGGQDNDAGDVGGPQPV